MNFPQSLVLYINDTNESVENIVAQIKFSTKSIFVIAFSQ